MPGFENLEQELSLNENILWQIYEEQYIYMHIYTHMKSIGFWVDLS